MLMEQITALKIRGIFLAIECNYLMIFMLNAGNACNVG